MSGVIVPYKGISPKIADDAFIAPNATVIGNVEIGARASIWYNCVIRGDVHEIRIGARTNIQDGTIIHCAYQQAGTYIGDDVLIGHMAILHACTVGDAAFVGMGAIVLDEAVVEAGAMVAAGAMVTPGKIVPSGQLWTGRPAKFARDLTPEEISFNNRSVAHYAELGQEYRQS